MRFARSGHAVHSSAGRCADIACGEFITPVPDVGKALQAMGNCHLSIEVEPDSVLAPSPNNVSRKHSHDDQRRFRLVVGMGGKAAPQPAED
jgi:hypothetical protein